MTMKPPFSISPAALKNIALIERLLGNVDSLEHPRPKPQLRKANRVRTIQGSLAIEGNTLDLDQVTALVEGKRIIGKKSEIREVLNAIQVYDQLSTFHPGSERSLLKAHQLMMSGLVENAGRWRRGGVGIMKGSAIAHVAPPAARVPGLMKALLGFIKTDESHPLIKAAVFHYEMEFIHPFSDGNGRVGRFWHSLLLYHYHPVFEFTPVESLIKERQQEYYRVLAACDGAGHSTAFVEFALEVVQQALSDLVTNIEPETATTESRLLRAREQLGRNLFTRKDYLRLHKSISTATASRDLKEGVKAGMLVKTGERALTVYRYKAGLATPAD